MSYIEMAIFEKVVAECEYVEGDELKKVIFAINNAYHQALLKKDKADFVSIRDEVLEFRKLYNLFDFKPYKSAIGKYYGRKKAKKKKRGYEVLEADGKSVLIAFTSGVTLLFHVRTGSEPLNLYVMKRIPTNAWVSNEEIFLKAKRQAIAIIRSRQK